HVPTAALAPDNGRSRTCQRPLSHLPTAALAPANGRSRTCQRPLSHLPTAAVRPWSCGSRSAGKPCGSEPQGDLAPPAAPSLRRAPQEDGAGGVRGGSPSGGGQLAASLVALSHK